MADTLAFSKTVAFTAISQPTAVGGTYTGISATDVDNIIKEVLTREFRQRGIALSVAVTSS